MEPLEFQRSALNEIVARARAFYTYHEKYREIGISPRWATIMVAQTGVGKTAVATMAATRAGASLLRVSAPSWGPLGANNRGARETSGVIAEHVSKHAKTLLCIDEADKLLDKSGDNSWKSYVRNEIFDLLDGRWPCGLTMPDNDDDPNITIESLTDKLRNSVFILGIGTFQSWFDDAKSRRSIGFQSEINSEKEEISSEIIAEQLPRELANRFNSSVVRMPELGPGDYYQIANEAETKLPETIRAAFRSEVERRITEAIAAKKGFRFLEEGLMEVFKNLPPEPPPPIPDIFQITADIDLCTL